MENEIKPTLQEVERWLLDSFRHANHVEYYLHKLGINDHDDERPHDLIGPGNKFEWDVVKGMALLYREPQPDFKTYILPSIEFHRQQRHHRMFNDPDPNDKDKPPKEATEYDLIVGTVDTICSIREKRIVGGSKEDKKGMGKASSWETIQDRFNDAEKEPNKYKRDLINTILPEMREIEVPKLDLIKTTYDFYNIGISHKMYLTMLGVGLNDAGLIRFKYHHMV